MAKRIVKRTLANGSIGYVVQTNRLWGVIPVKWHDMIVTYHGAGFDFPGTIMVETYEEARIIADIPLEEERIVKQEVVKKI